MSAPIVGPVSCTTSPEYIPISGVDLVHLPPGRHFVRFDGTPEGADLGIAFLIHSGVVAKVEPFVGSLCAEVHVGERGATLTAAYRVVGGVDADGLPMGRLRGYALTVTRDPAMLTERIAELEDLEEMLRKRRLTKEDRDRRRQGLAMVAVRGGPEASLAVAHAERAFDECDLLELERDALTREVALAQSVIETLADIFRTAMGMEDDATLDEDEARRWIDGVLCDREELKSQLAWEKLQHSKLKRAYIEDRKKLELERDALKEELQQVVWESWEEQESLEYELEKE